MGSTVMPSLRYGDAKRAVRWLQDAFGFEAGLVVEGDDGRIVHAQLRHGDGMVMVSSAGAEIVMEPEPQEYGGELYTCRDFEGFIWSFGSYDPWA